MSRTVGGSILFKCNATGSPIPKISWKKGTEDVTDGARYKITDEGLTITNIEESDVGDYFCMATSSVGTNKQMSTLTSVLGKCDVCTALSLCCLELSTVCCLPFVSVGMIILSFLRIGQ